MCIRVCVCERECVSVIVCVWVCGWVYHLQLHRCLSRPGPLSEQLNKIDEDIKKLLTDKLTILRAMQGGVGGDRVTLRRKPGGAVARGDSGPTESPGDPRDLVAVAIEQGE